MEKATSLMSDVLGKEMVENGIRVATDLQAAFRKAAKAYRACEQAGLALTAFLLAENLGTYKEQLKKVGENQDGREHSDNDNRGHNEPEALL